MIIDNQAFIAWHPSFRHFLPAGHRFPMEKYRLLHDQLLWEGIVEEKDFWEPERVGLKRVESVHDSNYVQKVRSLALTHKEELRLGFPQSDQLVERELRIAKGTIHSAKVAVDRGIGFNIAGGTHHAGFDWAEGFCLFNDQAIAARYLIDEMGFKQILIIDLDVHQGNGTANIFEREPRIFTFSMHGEHNFPFEKERSDWDIGLPDKMKGKAYLKTLAAKLEELPKKVRPEFVFFQAGADVLKTDKMGRLALTIQDCRERDRLVFEFCKKWHLPVEVSMGGGYSHLIKDVVNAHCNTYKMGINLLLK